MAKLGRAKLVEVLMVVPYDQPLVLIDESDLLKEHPLTVRELLNGFSSKKFSNDDEILSLYVKDNKIYILVDIIRKKLLGGK